MIAIDRSGGQATRLGFIELATLRQTQPEPHKLQKLAFHFWIVSSVGFPRTVHCLLAVFADLLIQIVRRHLVPFGRGPQRPAYREIGI